MAYTITTKKLMAITAAPGCDDYITRSRRAVATLNEARGAVQAQLEATGWSVHPASDLPTEAGGSIGPLPDGTVIEVEFWGATRAVNWMVEHGHDPAVEFFIDAYNNTR